MRSNRTTTYTYSVRGWVATGDRPDGLRRHVHLHAHRQESGTYQAQGFQLETSVLTYNADDRLSPRPERHGRDHDLHV